MTETTPGAGHNSNAEAGLGGIAAERLQSLVGRIERLEAEKAAISRDIREVYAEAKGAGFDVKVLRVVVNRRKMDKDERARVETMIETYLAAIESGAQP
jgi:uncharacterized protein (UPF0335 family)